MNRTRFILFVAAMAFIAYIASRIPHAVVLLNTPHLTAVKWSEIRDNSSTVNSETVDYGCIQLDAPSSMLKEKPYATTENGILVLSLDASNKIKCAIDYPRSSDIDLTHNAWPASMRDLDYASRLKRVYSFSSDEFSVFMSYSDLAEFRKTALLSRLLRDTIASEIKTFESAEMDYVMTVCGERVFGEVVHKKHARLATFRFHPVSNDEEMRIVEAVLRSAQISDPGVSCGLRPK